MDIARLRSNLPPLPDRMKALPVDKRGFPVPFFVAWLDEAGNETMAGSSHGRPDFRIVGIGKVEDCVRRERCWLCGQRLGAYKAFVVGPMCAVNRVSSEPPSHRECAEFAAKACPFLTQPRMRRNEKDVLDKTCEPGGIMIRRNPGVALVWVTREFRPFRAGRGLLFRIGPHDNVHWYAEGREATRDEVMASIDSGLPILRQEAERDGPQAVQMLARGLAEALRLVPGESA